MRACSGVSTTRGYERGYCLLGWSAAQEPPSVFSVERTCTRGVRFRGWCPWSRICLIISVLVHGSHALHNRWPCMYFEVCGMALSRLGVSAGALEVKSCSSLFKG